MPLFGTLGFKPSAYDQFRHPGAPGQRNPYVPGWFWLGLIPPGTFSGP